MNKANPTIGQKFLAGDKRKLLLIKTMWLLLPHPKFQTYCLIIAPAIRITQSNSGKYQIGPRPQSKLVVRVLGVCYRASETPSSYILHHILHYILHFILHFILHYSQHSRLYSTFTLYIIHSKLLHSNLMCSKGMSIFVPIV